MKKPLSFNNRFLTGLSLIILLLFLGAPCLADVSYTFQWDPNHANDNVVTYRFYWSTTSGDFSGANMDEIPNVASGDFDPAAPQYIKSFPNPPPGEEMDAMYFIVTAVDDRGLESDDSIEIDTSAPQVTSLPTVVSVTESTATISWTTDKPGTSIVEYGATTAYGSTAPVPPSTEYITDHLVTISGLTNSSTYHFQVSSVNLQGVGPDSSPNDANPSADYTFATAGAGQTDTTLPVITNIPGANNVTDTTATITWTTDEPSDSVVQYGLTTSYGSTRTLDADVVSHSVQIQGLSADTTYQFRVRSTDIAGNGPTNSANYSFTTEPTPDTAMPVITSTPTATSVTDTTATIVWATDEPATSVVEFGETTSYTRSSSLSNYVTNHSVTLTLLKDATLYHFRVGSTDAAGNGPRNSSDSTFTTDATPDTEAPVVISPPSVTGTTDTTATIVWQTDETGNSQVRFDTVASSWETLGTTFNSAAMVTQHSVTLTDLTVNQTYYFRVGSTDTAGNGPDPDYTSDNNPTNTVLSFTTKPDSTPPVVTSAPTVTGVTDSTVAIAWDTDEPSNSQVRYDTVSRTWAAYTKTKTDAGMVMVTHHTVTITGLLNDQPYFFRVGSTDLGGNSPDPATTGDNNPTNTELGFTTQPDSTPPTITSPPTVTGIAESTATIAWSTDEPSNSRVQYGTAGASWDNYLFSQNTADMVTNHVVTLSGLDSSTAYFFRVGSTDIEGNGPTVSTEVTFSTGAIADVTPPQFDSPSMVTAKTHNSAIINWTTNEPSNSEVQFDEVSGLWGSYFSNATDSNIVTIHSITITGLSGSTLYYVRVGSSDLSGNFATSNEISFTTDADPDTEPPQIILPPTVTIKTNATATIEWTTDEESNSQIRYGTQSSVWSNYPLTRSDAVMVTNHSLTVTNLTGDTTYYFRVGSTDASGNGPVTSNEVVFVTVPDPDITAPQFTSPPTVTAKTNNSATIAWSTDEPGNSQVQYGDNAATWGNYDNAENDAEMVSFHTVTISGLIGETLYYFRVATSDAAGNGPSISSEITFRTDEDPDVIAPRITSPPTVTDKTVSAATIEWETDEPCNSEVRYDINSLDWLTYRYIESDSDMVTTHSVTITGLDLLTDCESGGCRIYLMVGSTDAAGNGPDPDGDDTNNPFTEDTFTTEIEPDENAPVVISGPTVTAVDSETAIAEWETDEPSNSIVKYGLESSTWLTYTHSENDAALVTQHSVTLTNLNNFVVYETEYVDIYDDDGNVIGQEEVVVAVPMCAQGNCTFYYQIGSTDALGNGPTLNQSATNPSAEDTFTTTESPDDTAPVVSGVNVAWFTNKTALITWQTSEPGNSQVRYGQAPATWENYTGSENDPDMVMNHSLTITALQPLTLYYFRVGSTDARGNGPAPSSEDQLTTADGSDESAPQISNFFIQPTSGETAVATWTTDEPGNSQVRYDTQSRLWDAYAYSENDAGMTTQHRVTLTGLSPSTLYYVRVSSTDASGNNYATNSGDDNPSGERNLTTTTEDPPSIVEYPEIKYPRLDATANTIEITYDELNMRNAEAEGNYILAPALTFANPGNSIDLVSTNGGQSTYRQSFVAVEAYTVYSLTVGDGITDADEHRVQPNTVLINDNDSDDLPDDWETDVGLDPTSGDPSVGQGREGDFDDDGYVNYEEFINNTDPTDNKSSPAPSDIFQVMPHDQAGLADVFRVPNNSPFAIFISGTGGIDITTPDNVVFRINDGTNAAYEIDLGDTQVVRTIKMDETDVNTAVSLLWVVYDRSLDTYGVFDFDAVVNITATVANNTNNITEEEYSFKVEGETEHDDATDPDQLPAYEALGAGDPAVTDADYTYDAGFQLTEGDMAGFKLVYNTTDITPELGPTDELPVFNVTNAIAVGDSINLQPPNIFSTPIKLIVPTPGRNDVSGIGVYFYNGEEWVLGCDAQGNSPIEGWMVPGSRVNASGSIQLKIYHFSGIQAAVLERSAGGGGTGDDSDEAPEEDVANCFIRTVGF